MQWDDLALVEEDYASVANAIAQFEPLIMVADASNSERARQLCGDNVTVMEMPLDDSWMRDTGPSFIKHRGTGAVAGIDWRFNCWGVIHPITSRMHKLPTAYWIISICRPITPAWCLRVEPFMWTVMVRW